jgi:hypothetical protein
MQFLLDCEEMNNASKSCRPPDFICHTRIRNIFELELDSSVRNLADTTNVHKITILHLIPAPYFPTPDRRANILSLANETQKPDHRRGSKITKKRADNKAFRVICPKCPGSPIVAKHEVHITRFLTELSR